MPAGSRVEDDAAAANRGGVRLYRVSGLVQRSGSAAGRAADRPLQPVVGRSRYAEQYPKPSRIAASVCFTSDRVRVSTRPLCHHS